MFKKIAVFFVIPALVILSIAFFHNNKIHIAFIGPLSGPSAKSGQELLNGIKQYVDHINKTGGVNNAKVVVDPYDDKGDPKLSKEQAEKIAKDDLAVGVIGHTSSDAADAAGPIYTKMNIPVLLPCATNVELTQKHETLFRTIFNDNDQAEYMCLFAKYLLNAKKVVIVYSETLFGKGLMERLSKYAKNIDLEVSFTTNVKHINNNIKKGEVKDVVILLATSTSESMEAIDTIRKITDIPLVGPDSVAALFAEGVTDFAHREVYTTTPILTELIGDAGEFFMQNYKKVHNQLPNWFAIYGHDSAKTLLDAVDETNGSTVKEIREGVLQRFKKGLISKTVEVEDDQTIKYPHITGEIAFEKQESNRNVQFGVLNAHEVIAFPVQLMRIKNKLEIADYDDLKAKGSILEEKNGVAFFKTDIVSTGININEISVLNVEKGTYMIDFYMWLRYSKDKPESEDIIFLNSMHNIVLPKELDHSLSHKPADKEKEKDVTFEKLIAVREDKRTTYKLYRIKNIFRMDAFKQMRPPFYDITHTLGVSFRHALYDKTFIRYAKDNTGVQDTMRNLSSTTSMFEKTGWKPTNLSSYEDDMKMDAMGNPHYLNSKSDVAFSRFNEKMVITDTMFSFFDFINYEWAKIILIVSLLCILVLGIWKSRKPEHHDILNMIDVIPYTGCLVATQLIVMEYVMNTDWLYEQRFGINLSFDVLWWFIFAGGVNAILQAIVWRRLEQRTGRPVPKLLYWCVSLVVYTFAIFGIIAFVLDMPITSLLASTSLIMFLIVMAIQMNVSNIFSGIFLNVDGKFREGDWIEVEEVEGWIMQTGWRSTSIKTENGNIVNIPNTKMAECMISNYTYPNLDYDMKVRFGISQKHQPDFVKQIIREAVIQDKDIKAVEVITLEYQGEAIIYEATLTVEDYSDPIHDRTRDNMFTNIWNYLHKAGLTAALRPSRDVYMTNIQTVTEIDVEKMVKTVFNGATASQLKKLITNAEQITVPANERLTLKDAVCIIGHGMVLAHTPIDETDENKELINNVRLKSYSAIANEAYDELHKESLNEVDTSYHSLHVGAVLGLKQAQNLSEDKYETLTTVILVKIKAQVILAILNENDKLSSRFKLD